MAGIAAELANRGRLLAPDFQSALVELLLESLDEPALSNIEAAWAPEIFQQVKAYI